MHANGAMLTMEQAVPALQQLQFTFAALLDRISALEAAADILIRFKVLQQRITAVEQRLQQVGIDVLLYVCQHGCAISMQTMPRILDTYSVHHITKHVSTVSALTCHRCRQTVPQQQKQQDAAGPEVSKPAKTTGKHVMTQLSAMQVAYRQGWRRNCLRKACPSSGMCWIDSFSNSTKLIVLALLYCMLALQWLRYLDEREIPKII